MTTTSSACALRHAIEAVPRPDPSDLVPDFSLDGGVTVFDNDHRSARLQPLGLRTRITLADRDRLVAEAEVDGETLIVGIGVGGSVYGAAASCLDHENRASRP